MAFNAFKLLIIIVCARVFCLRVCICTIGIAVAGEAFLCPTCSHDQLYNNQSEA